MTHILTLISIGTIVLISLIILYASFGKEQKVLKHTRKPGRRIWYKVITYHPLILPAIILLFSSSFTSVILLREINIFNPDNAKDLIRVLSWTLGSYIVIVFIWIFGLQQRVNTMGVRKFNRTFSKVYKSNETLYNVNNLNYFDRCKITTLQIQLYSPERVTPKMALEARIQFKEKFIVKSFDRKALRKARLKSLKVAKKNRKINNKMEKKNSY